MEKQIIHNLIILDESGSMESIKSQIISGFNETVQTIKGSQKRYPEQEHYVTLISFNSFGQKLIHLIDPVDRLELIDEEKFQPNASTPLFDAIGFGVNKLRQFTTRQPECNVLVTIMTDGAENASREFSGSAIKLMIEELKQQKWTFTYIGTDHDVEKIAINLSITNTMSFSKDTLGIKKMFAEERNAREAYYKKVQNRENTSEDYFKKD